MGKGKKHSALRNFWYTEGQYYCRLSSVCRATRSLFRQRSKFSTPKHKKAQNKKGSISRTLTVTLKQLNRVKYHSGAPARQPLVSSPPVWTSIPGRQESHSISDAQDCCGTSYIFTAQVTVLSTKVFQHCPGIHNS